MNDIECRMQDIIDGGISENDSLRKDIDTLSRIILRIKGWDVRENSNTCKMNTDNGMIISNIPAEILKIVESFNQHTLERV